MNSICIDDFDIMAYMFSGPFLFMYMGGVLALILYNKYWSEYPVSVFMLVLLFGMMVCQDLDLIDESESDIVLGMIMFFSTVLLLILSFYKKYQTIFVLCKGSKDRRKNRRDRRCDSRLDCMFCDNKPAIKVINDRRKNST